MIVLTFWPLVGEAPVSVRGAYFRICADATLRGPDNAIAAHYCKGLWQLAHRRHRSFECSGPFYLRVMLADGRNELTGPYDFIKVIDRALFTHTAQLGAIALPPFDFHSPELWREISFLPGG